MPRLFLLGVFCNAPSLVGLRPPLWGRQERKASLGEAKRKKRGAFHSKKDAAGGLFRHTKEPVKNRLSACQKRSFLGDFSDILRTGDEDAEERNGATASHRDAMHRYAGTAGTPAEEDRRGGGFWAHLRSGKRFVLRG